MFYIHNVPDRVRLNGKHTMIFPTMLYYGYRRMFKKMIFIGWRSHVAMMPFVLLLSHSYVYAEGPETAVSNPCAGPLAMLAIPDGPTVAYSACVVPFGHVVLETDFQHSYLRAPGGTAENYPEAEIRIGLPGNNEFVVLAPNYNNQRPEGAPSNSGFSATTLAVKHEIGYTDKWLGAVEALFTLPSGSKAFGSHGLGVDIHGTLTYSLTDTIGLTLQLGVSSETGPELSGGKRFTSFNPIVVATWQPVSKLQLYDEIYGQTKTSATKGQGFNMDGGIQYLITPSWEVDVEEGVRLTGNLGGFTHYHGVGMRFLF